MEYVSIEKDFKLDVEKVLEYAVVAKEGKAIVAVLTEPIFLRSEREKIKSEIIRQAKTGLNAKDIKVTFSAVAYAKIAKGISYDEAEKMI